MNTCVILPSAVSNERGRLVGNLYESKHHWAQSPWGFYHRSNQAFST